MFPSGRCPDIQSKIYLRKSVFICVICGSLSPASPLPSRPETRPALGVHFRRGGWPLPAKKSRRREFSPDLWPSISERLGPSAAAPTTATAQNWQPFLLLGLLLVIFKLVEMIPERDLGLMFKLVPLLFVIAVFGYLKENPFKINLELKLEGDK